ncbi:MAG TPA: phage holin family protein [Pseudonocardia sp.]|jgi:putative membrane protein|uniref:phage holin family protein n=1 Tax=Pseudonocardia sp. TaxID=60912 RepID=UPI002C99EA39|nr:phage holin family protein [Pseudonocardia sp.]HTF55355.1 phage holin family protein [Pseudonocardia sp.]
MAIALVIKVLVTAVALWVCTFLVDGIAIGGSDQATRIGTLIVVALIFGLVNAVIKPVIKTIGCAFYILTLGLIGLVVNALLFLLVGWISDQLGLPFEVAGFWPAFWGAIVVAVVGFILHLIIPDSLDRE